MNTGLIITAAGLSRRFDSPTNKLLLEVDGIPIIRHTYNQLTRSTNFRTIIITAPASLLDQYQSIFKDTDALIIKGGDTRMESVKNAVHQLKEVSHIMIHDGARPNPSQSLIKALIDSPHNAIIPVCPLTDTIKEVSGDKIISTVDRRILGAAQTPQRFNRDYLIKAYETNNDPSTITDESALLEAIGMDVHTISGEKNNIKITYSEDVSLLSFLRSLS